jgi:hypothetical protein
LVLPKQLKLLTGELRQLVPATPNAKTATITWDVQVVDGGRFRIRIESSTGLTRSKTLTLSPSDDSLFGR